MASRRNRPPPDPRPWRWIVRGAYLLIVGYALQQRLTDKFDGLHFHALLWGSAGLGEGLLYWTHPARTVGTRVIAGWLAVLGAFLVGVGFGGGATWSADRILFVFVPCGVIAILGLMHKARETLQTVDPDVFS